MFENKNRSFIVKLESVLTFISPLLIQKFFVSKAKKLSKSFPHDAKSKTSVDWHSNSWDCSEMISFAIDWNAIYQYGYEIASLIFCFFIVETYATCNIHRKIPVAMPKRFFKQLTKAPQNSTSLYDACLKVREWNFVI